MRWNNEQGLQISRTKTEMIMLRDQSKAGKKVNKRGEKRLLTRGALTGSLVTTEKGGKRPPCIKIDNKGMRCPDYVKYLGVTFGQKLTTAKHVSLTAAKGKRLFQNLAPLIRAKWGLKHDCLEILYRGVFLPVVMYAVGAWGDLLALDLKAVLEMGRYRKKKILNGKRRPILLLIILMTVLRD